MNREDEDRRIEMELARRERGEAAGTPPATPEPAARKTPGTPSPPPPLPPPDMEALFGRLKGEIDDMEGRVTATVDAVAERVAPVAQAAGELREWTRGAVARAEAVDRIAPLLEQALERERRIHRPARRRTRAALFALALAVAVAAGLVVQWQTALIGTADPTDGWRDHLWERYGAELKDCVTRAEGEGKAMLCPVLDPEPALP